MRVRVGDVIEPAALRRAATLPIVNFFDSIKTMNPRYIYRSEQYNCQTNELMFHNLSRWIL